MQERRENDMSIFGATARDSPEKEDFLRSIMESHYGETLERSAVIDANQPTNAFNN